MPHWVTPARLGAKQPAATIPALVARSKSVVAAANEIGGCKCNLVSESHRSIKNIEVNKVRMLAAARTDTDKRL